MVQQKEDEKSDIADEVILLTGDIYCMRLMCRESTLIQQNNQPLKIFTTSNTLTSQNNYQNNIMEAASSAINKILTGSGQQEPKKDESVAPAVDDSHVGQKDTTVEQEVAPAVQHEHVKKEHETREQTVVDRERHQDHYHTTVQPLKDQEIKAEKHDHKTANTEHRDINNDTEGDKVKAKFDADQAAFKSTSEEKRSETKSKDDTVVGEHVHHHVHEASFNEYSSRLRSSMANTHLCADNPARNRKGYVTDFHFLKQAFPL